MKGTDFLHALGCASGAVVDLSAPLAAFVGPGEVGDGDDEEGVAGVSDTGQGVVPEDGELVLIWFPIRTWCMKERGKYERTKR